MTILGAWIGVGAVVSTIWSKYVNDRWWSGTPLGFVVQIVIWPVIATILFIDATRSRP